MSTLIVVALVAVVGFVAWKKVTHTKNTSGNSTSGGLGSGGGSSNNDDNTKFSA